MATAVASKVTGSLAKRRAVAGSFRLKAITNLIQRLLQLACDVPEQLPIANTQHMVRYMARVGTGRCCLYLACERQVGLI